MLTRAGQKPIPPAYVYPEATTRYSGSHQHYVVVLLLKQYEVPQPAHSNSEQPRVGQKQQFGEKQFKGEALAERDKVMEWSHILPITEMGNRWHA